MVLLGISGAKRSGKDTFADEFLKKNKNYVKYTMSTPIKKICKELFLLKDDQLYDEKEKIDERWGVSPRQMFQILGTDIFRNNILQFFPNITKVLKNDTIWIHHFKLFYESNKNKNIIITDIRFIDEAQLIKDLNGIIIKIKRNEIKIDDTNMPIHESEKHFDDINHDYMINNNGDLNEYKKKINKLLEILNL
tara:strand:+ start:232 stop:810 length:579 start_codon:yes stop_codon:yes gene_type:complete